MHKHKRKIKSTKTILVLIIICLSGVVFYLLNRNQGFNIGIVDLEPKFKWGVQGSAFFLNNIPDPYQPTNVDIQIEYLKKLGVKYVRANLEFTDSSQPQYDVNDDYIDKLVKAGLYPVVVIDPSFNDISTSDIFQVAYKLGKDQASRYQGKVRYFQLANEISGNVVAGGFDGETFSSKLGDFYSKEKYEKFKEWIRGLSDGISAGNPKAKKILSGHWVYYDLLDYLIDDMVDFDIIGWAFYSDYLPTISLNEHDKVGGETKLNLSEELSKYNKEIWIIEANRAHGSYQDGEKDQEEFIKKTAQQAYDNSKLSGYFVFNLIDQPEKQLDQDRHWGLLRVKDIEEKFFIESEKPAFEVYQEVIKKNK